MIQNIEPHLFSNTFVKVNTINQDDYIFHFKEKLLLLKRNREGFEIPRRKDFTVDFEDGIFLFSLENENSFLVQNLPEQDGESFLYYDVKDFRTINNTVVDWTGSVAYQLMVWYKQNTFCGSCGTPTQLKTDERAVVCPACQKTMYPTISPAIIVAILSKNKILLARGVNFRDNMYSLVAGYVDVGETLEDAVIREAKEEVGLEVRDIQYYSSQPWPFSGSMMIGFIAEADDAQPIHIDEKEIAHSQWFSRDDLPNYPADRSIAGEIIDKFKNGKL